MKRTTKSDPALSGEQKLRLLESELTKVTEDFRLAKLAVKEAKADAKALKKQKKRALKALIAAQAEQDKSTPAGTGKDAAAAPVREARSKRKAAASPDVEQRVGEVAQVVRKPRRAKKLPVAAATIDSSAAESMGAAASESQLDDANPGSPVGSAQ